VNDWLVESWPLSSDQVEGTRSKIGKVMRRIVFLLASLGLLIGPGLADAPQLPSTVKQLKGQEIAKFLDGKKFDLTIYDADAETTATSNWDWKSKQVYGDYVYKGTPGTFKNAWIVKGNTNCAEKSGKKWICQKIYVDGDTMYEVNAKGKIHAVSKLAK
jgi:hypothetical protein